MAEASSTEDVITLRIRFKSETLEKFAERYAVDLGPNEVFVRTREPLPVGTALNFDFTLHDGSPLLAGRGTVIWAREPDVARTEPAGMGIRFDNLTPHSRELLSKILERKPRTGGTDRHRAVTPRGGVPEAPVPTSPVPAPMATATTPRSPVPAKSSDFPVDEDQERTEIARMPPSFYYENAEEETRARDGLPEAGMLDDLDDITSPRAEMPLPPTSPGPRLNSPPEPARREPLPPASRSPSRPEPPISWRPPTTPAPGSLASALRGPVQTGAATPSRGSPAAREGGPTPAFGARSPGPEPLPGRTPPPGPRAPVPMLRETVRGPFGRGEAPTPRPEPPAFAPPPHSGGEGLDMATPAWPMLGMQPQAGATSEVDAPAMLSEDVIPEPRRSGTGKTWVALGLLAVAAVVGGLWAVPKLMQPRPEVVSAPPAAEPAAAPTETPSANPYAPPGAAPSADETPPAGTPPAGATGTPPVAAAPPAAAGTEASPPPSAPASAPAPAPSPPVAATPPRRKVRNVGPPRRSADPPTTVIAGDTPPPAAAATGTAPGTAAEPGAAPAIPTPADPGEEVFWLYVRTTPPGADVLIDGQVEGKTPFQRRIFDPNRTYALTIRKAGFEPVERSMSATDQWVKKGNQRTYTVTAKLSPAAGQAPSTEAAPAETASPSTPPAPPPERKANPFDEPGAGAQP